MSGSAGAEFGDTLKGGCGVDVIFDGGGKDKISGGSSDDDPYGDSGIDNLFGGWDEDLQDADLDLTVELSVDGRALDCQLAARIDVFE
jgi:Ca2+-binding RTX toxin-like protein